MSFVATQEVKEQVRQATDLVTLIGTDLPVRRQGALYCAHCPWHDDARPSLTINPERQTWRCWVCNIGGDVYSYVMQRERVDFREALEMLADAAGIQLKGSKPTKPGEPNDKKTLHAAMAWAEQTFANYLRESADAAQARDYFRDRGIDSESIKRFRLGFSPDSWQWLIDRARSTSFSPPVLEAAGLIAKSDTGRYYDRFRGRAMFPIRDMQSRPIAFGGRILPHVADQRSAKYVNSPETRLFSKSEQIYALDLARDAVTQTRQVVVVEGYTDVIMAHQMGLRNAVAVLGTALNLRHVQLLRRYADTIVLLLDGDEAGQRRTNEVLELFVASEVDLRILTLPQGLDPCDYLLDRGVDALRDRIDGAMDAFDHAMLVQTSGIDLLSDTHRAHQALEHLLGMLAKAPRLTGGTKSSRVLRERQVLARLARDFRLDENTLRERLRELRRASTTPPRMALRDISPAEDVGALRVDSLDPVDAELLEILIRHADLVHIALEELSSVDSQAAQQILSHFRELADRGERCDFHNLMTAIEDHHLKKLLVDLDERAAEKEPLAHEDAAARLRQTIDHLSFRGEDQQNRDKLAALEQGKVTESEAVAFLEDLIERKRKRQGIPAPTDG